MKIKFTLSLKQAKKQGVSLDSNEPKGLFLKIGSGNIVDRIVGYHKNRGFIADYAYYTGNIWIKDILDSLFKYKDGFVRITIFI